MAIVATEISDTPVECVWFRRRGNVVERCDAEGVVRAGVGSPHWKVCREHVSWWRPPYMPTWWYVLSAVLVALVISALVISIAFIAFVFLYVA